MIHFFIYQTNLFSFLSKRSFLFIIHLVSFRLSMDQNEYNQISAYHLNKAIPNMCIDNLSRNAFVRKSKRYHFSDGILQKNGRTVVSASAACEALKHFHDVILDHKGAGKALESFAAERYDIYKLRDICHSLTSFCTVCAYRRLVTIKGKRMVQISEKKRITVCRALGLSLRRSFLLMSEMLLQ